MKAYGRDVVGSARCFLIKGLNIFEYVGEAQTSGIKFVGSEPVEHKGVV